jgi:hypothetical protein
MLRDTVVELLDHLETTTGGTTDFDRGYRTGLGYAIDVLKMQCAAFGLPDDLKLPPLDSYR